MLGKVIKLKVFIEGVPVNAYRVTVQTSIGAPSMAIIDIPPAEEFFERFIDVNGKLSKKTGVLPRSLVHVFYEDSDAPDKLPRLLFEGEFVRFEYAKETSRRSLRLVARDLSNLLNSIYVR